MKEYKLNDNVFYIIARSEEFPTYFITEGSIKDIYKINKDESFIYSVQPIYCRSLTELHEDKIYETYEEAELNILRNIRMAGILCS